MTLFVQIIYTLITVVLILVVLLQAGRGGGLGTALGGGSSQSVFGGSGGADFLTKLTQGLAIGFMVCAVYLAYASAHTGSDRLKSESDKLGKQDLVADDAEINYEMVGPNPQRLPLPGGLPTTPVVEEDEEAPAPEGEPAAMGAGEAADEEPAEDAPAQ
jgi:preprotein translocase subunit SecG